MRKLVVFLAALVCSLALIAHTSHYSGAVDAAEADDHPEVDKVNSAEDEPVEEELESEMQLKRMLMYVTPLMAILRSKPQGQSFSGRSSRSDTQRKSFNDRSNFSDREAYIDDYDRNGYDRYGYDRNSFDRYGYDRNGYDRYGNERNPLDRNSYNNFDRNGYGGGGGGYCCNQKDDLLPLLALLALAGLLLYLVLIASTTTTTGKRRKRFIGDDNLVDLSVEDNIVLLDGPTWLSMVHELWEQDSALENTACTQETLCRMNRLAMAAPGQAGWAVSLSSLPLSYLLHTRHTGGFGSYMDAALMGRSGANCTELYKSCPRLSY